jgi:hypothetical protein
MYHEKKQNNEVRRPSFFIIYLRIFQLHILLFLYALIFLSVMDVMSIKHNGRYILIKEQYIIELICLAAIEVLNQITFWYAGKNGKKAAIMKCVCFWCIFTTGMMAYMFLLARAPQKVVFDWHIEIGNAILYLIFAFCFPFYSLDTRYRFLVLRRHFQGKLGMMNKIEIEFRNRGVVQGKTLYLKPVDAIEMVKKCKNCGFRIFGIDGVRITDNTTQPDMNHSIDFGGLKIDCWAGAEQFLKERLDSDLYFEIVC